MAELPQLRLFGELDLELAQDLLPSAAWLAALALGQVQLQVVAGYQRVAEEVTAVPVVAAYSAVPEPMVEA